MGRWGCEFSRFTVWDDGLEDVVWVFLQLILNSTSFSEWYINPE